MPIFRAETRARALIWLVILALATGCGAAGNAGDDDATRPVAAPGERALPRFEGVSLTGEALDTGLFRRKRGVIFLFAETEKGADDLAGVVSRVRAASRGANVEFLGISRDAETKRGLAFQKRHGLDFPILHDPSGAISRRLRAEPGTAAVLVVDGEGYLVLGYLAQPEIPIENYDQVTREALRIEGAADSIGGSYGLRPLAPDFRVLDLEGKALALSDLDDKVVVVIFFLHTCPHCHDSLRFLEKLRVELGHEDLVIAAISVQDKPDDVRRIGKGLDLGFPLYMDPEGAARRAYAHAGTVPDSLVLDRQHRVVGRHSGFNSRIEALMTMSIRQALGVENPILLTRGGYSGAEACGICHESQHQTFSLTQHAYAFDTLVEHGSNRDPECLACHTVGWDQTGGYTAEKPRDYLEGVQCESCHGRGGPHQSPDFLADGFEQVCAGCHNPEHSLRFDFAERLPLVSHSANLQFSKLGADERRALLERRAKRDRQLFDEADFVGSERCQACHSAEYERWASSDHANSFATLSAHDADKNADCQTCHTTGFASDGGFPKGGTRFEHVGCESCHGPGGNHVAENARKDGTILALTDKCDTCVVLQICGSCHDDANDPGFEFEVLDKIELIRHGFRDRPAPGSAE